MASRSKGDMAGKRTDTRGGRFYTVDGSVSPLTGTDQFPSVTTILSVINKPALVQWAANTERAACVETAADFYADLARLPKPMDRATFVAQFQSRLTKTKAHQREMDAARHIGTQCHHLIEWSIRKALKQKVGPEPKVCDEALIGYMAFQDWVAAHRVTPIFIEQAVWHTRLGYAGTLDLLAEVDGALAVLDFKTSAQVYWEHHLQNAAYQDALIEMGQARPETGYILRLPKTLDAPEFEVALCPPRLELMPIFRALLRVWIAWSRAEAASLAAWKAKRDGKAA